MKRITTIAAGVLLGIGLPAILLGTAELASSNSTQQNRANAAVACLLGLPTTALGGVLIWQNQRQNQQQERDRLQATFFQLLRQGNGHINVLRFSMETQLSGEAAKAFLDERAKEFNAAFHVSEEGKLSYFFDGEFNQPALSTFPDQQTYDVLLEFFPAQNSRDVVKTVRDLTGLEWREAKALVKKGRSHAVPIGQGLERDTAEAFRQQLEALGARVLIVLR